MLTVIDIPVIQDLALTASIGVAVLIVTNLILLPVLLSYFGVSPAAAARSLAGASDGAGGARPRPPLGLARPLHRARAARRSRSSARRR